MELTKDLQQIIIDASEGVITLEKLQEIGDDLTSLGMDSLVQIKIFVLLEEKYEIEVDFEAVPEQVMKSIASLQAYVQEQLSQVG